MGNFLPSTFCLPQTIFSLFLFLSWTEISYRFHVVITVLHVIHVRTLDITSFLFLSLRASRCSSGGVLFFLPLFLISLRLSFIKIGCCAGISQPFLPLVFPNAECCPRWGQRLLICSSLFGSSFDIFGCCTAATEVINPLVLPSEISWSSWGQGAGSLLSPFCSICFFSAPVRGCRRNDFPSSVPAETLCRN